MWYFTAYLLRPSKLHTPASLQYLILFSLITSSLWLRLAWMAIASLPLSLILSLAIEPENDQSMGLLWQKLWNREPKPKPPLDETPTQKKQRQAQARKEARNRPFEKKESYYYIQMGGSNHHC